MEDTKTALRTQEWEKSWPHVNLTWLIDFSNQSPTLSFLVIFFYYFLHLLHFPCPAYHLSLFSHIPGGKMGIVALALWNVSATCYKQIPRVCVSILNSVRECLTISFEGGDHGFLHLEANSTIMWSLQ